MDLLTSIMHLVGSGATAYFTAHQIRYSQTRPNLLAGFHFAESGSVSMLEKLAARAEIEGDLWLAEKLKRHAADECRHGKIFAHAVKQLGKQLVDPQSLRENSQKTKPKQSGNSFFEVFFDGYDSEALQPEKIDWIVFMGSSYILELDACKDFVRMANVLPETELRERNLKKSLLSVAEDETRHAAYLYEAMQRRLPPEAIAATIEEWRTRKVRAMMAFATSLIQGGGSRSSLVQDSSGASESLHQDDFTTVTESNSQYALAS